MLFSLYNGNVTYLREIKVMFKFATSVEAVELADSYEFLFLERTTHWNSPHVKAMNEYNAFLFNAADVAADEFVAGDVMFLQNFVDKILPVWRDKVVHDVESGYSGRQHIVNKLDFANNVSGVSYSNRSKNYLSSGIISAVNDMLRDAYDGDISEDVFNSWISKTTNWMMYFSSTFYVRHLVWAGEYDISMFSKFKADRWVYTRMEVLDFISNKGYSPEQVHAYGVDSAKICSPAGLTYLSSISSPKVVKSLIGLDLNNREALTEDILKQLVEAGFASAAEVKNYARRFGVGWNDNDFFTRLINAKTLYPTLDSYVPAV